MHKNWIRLAYKVKLKPIMEIKCDVIVNETSVASTVKLCWLPRTSCFYSTYVTIGKGLRVFLITISLFNNTSLLFFSPFFFPVIFYAAGGSVCVKLICNFLKQYYRLYMYFYCHCAFPWIACVYFINKEVFGSWGLLLLFLAEWKTCVVVCLDLLP